MTDQPPKDRDDWKTDDDAPDELEGENRPRPSPPEGGETEGGERPPRPSQAEGEREA